MSKSLKGLLRELNIEVIPNSRNHSRGARQSCAGMTMRRIFELRGYAHLRSVLISICETKKNKRMLIEPVIWSISDVLHLKPEWLGDPWFNLLDEIELGALYERAKALRKVVEPRHVIAVTLIGEMERRLEDQPAQLAA